MNKLFDNLLLSSPNGGGLFFLHEANAFKIDNFDTTGLSIKGRKVLRGIQPQPSALYIYDVNPLEISKSTVPFDDIHDVYLDGQFVFLVGTSGNEIIKLDGSGGELQRWVLPGDMDSLHINCLAMWNGRIIFSAFGGFTENYGYKGKTEKSGFVQDLFTGQRLITGLSQPHSLVPIGQNLLLANSESKQLLEYGPSGDLIRALTLEGYTRGICVVNDIVYVGLSCSRNIELPSIESATVMALHRDTWEEMGRVKLPTAEIYAIQEIANPNDAIHVLATIASDSFSRLACTVAERDGQIANLIQAMTGRDAEISRLAKLIDSNNRELMLIQDSIFQIFAKSLLSIKHQLGHMFSLQRRVSL